jgi:hypothetical protein
MERKVEQEINERKKESNKYRTILGTGAALIQ